MEVVWHDLEARNRAGKEAKRVLGLAGEYLLAKANDTVPLEEGTLARSGSVDSNEEAAVVSYDTAYAIRLHENPQYHFKHGRRGKWLELTLQEQSRAIAGFLGGMKIA